MWPKEEATKGEIPKVVEVKVKMVVQTTTTQAMAEEMIPGETQILEVITKRTHANSVSPLGTDVINFDPTIKQAKNIATTIVVNEAPLKSDNQFPR